MTTKNYLAVLLTVMGTSVFASTSDSTFRKGLKIVPKISSNSYKVIYETPVKEPVFVSIKNSKGSLLVSERYSKTDGFILPVNLDGARSGSYTIEVKGKSSSVSEIINHISQADVLRDKMVIQKGSNGQFAIVGYDLGEVELNLEILDAKGNLAFKDELKSQGFINKAYRVSDKLSGEAKILVFHENDLLFETILNVN